MRSRAIYGLAGAALYAAPAASAAGCAPTSSPYASAVAATPGIVSYWRLGESSGTSACDAVGSNSGTS